MPVQPIATIDLTKKGILLVGLPLLFEVLFVILLGHFLNQSREEVARQIHSKAVLSQANVVSRLFLEADLQMSNYSIALTPIYRDRFNDVQTRFLDELRALVALGRQDNRREYEAIKNVERSAKIGLNELLQDLSAIDQMEGSVRESRQIFKHIRAVSHILDDDLAQVTAIEHEIQDATVRNNAGWQDNLNLLLALGIAANAAICIACAFYFSRDIRDRILLMQDNSYRLSSGKPLNPPQIGGDEIAELDRTFHKMAESLSEAQRKQRAMVANAVDVICSIDERGVFTEVSPAVLSAWGYEPEELIGQRFMNLLVDEDKYRTNEAIAHAREMDETLLVENRLHHKNGSIVEAAWAGSWSDDDRSLFCVVHDVTERKNMEKLKREFVQMISHDLRSPLTSLQMTLNMLLEGLYGSLSPAGRPRVEFAASDLSRLINMINQLVEFEHMESGKLDLVFDEVEVENMLARSVEAVRSLAEYNKIKLSVDACQESIKADGSRLIQVIVNLLGNAVKFSPPNSTITVAAFRCGDCLEVQVTDQGRGIPEEHCKKIFNRFEQVEIDDARVKGGSGLGLAICKAIVEEHGGTIGVNSKEGEGSTFWFRVPFIAVQAARA